VVAIDRKYVIVLLDLISGEEFLVKSDTAVRRA
jgi:hypothetical protein